MTIPFSAFFTRLREATGVSSQTALAEALGVHRSAVTQAKQRDAVPPKWILALSRRFSLSADWLEFGTGRARPADPAAVEHGPLRPLISALGLRPGWIYEVIASTLGENGPHAAPVGVWTPDGESLRAEMYKGSVTLANIARNGILGINLIGDPLPLYNALYRRDSLSFSTDGETPGAATPFAEGSDAWLELAPALLPGGPDTVYLKAALTRWRRFAPVRPLNRAAGLLLESLVLSTRRHLLPAESVNARLLENARVIRKVAPDSDYASAISELLAVCGLASLP